VLESCSRAEPGVVYERLADELGVKTVTVGKWCKRFGGGGSWPSAWRVWSMRLGQAARRRSCWIESKMFWSPR
jgi:hypothetical protein